FTRDARARLAFGPRGFACGRATPIFAIALEPASPLLDIRLPGKRIVRNGKLRLAQALDLVARPRCRLELEIGRGLAHPLLEIGNDGLEVVPDEHLARFGQTGVDGD